MLLQKRLSMRRNFLISFMVILFSIMLVACNTTSEAKNPEKTGSDQKEEIIYSNTDYGVTVYKTKGWKLGEELNSDRLHVKLKNNHTNAILTSLSTSKSFEEIKQELTVAAGNIVVMDDEKKYTSFKSTLNTSIRTDIYLRKQGDLTYIYTFLTPLANYKKAEDDIATLLDHIKLK